MSTVTIADGAEITAIVAFEVRTLKLEHTDHCALCDLPTICRVSTKALCDKLGCDGTTHHMLFKGVPSSKLGAATPANIPRDAVGRDTLVKGSSYVISESGREG